MCEDKKTAMVGVLVAALILSLLTLMIPVKAMAAVSAGLDFGPEIHTTGHTSSSSCKECIDIVSWSFGNSATGTTAGKVFKFTLRTSSASPVLLIAAEKKSKIRKVTLRVWNTSDKTIIPDIEIQFDDVVISSFFHMGTAGPNITTNPTEEVTFTYNTITFIKPK